jgi:hypothetical protein
MENAEFLAWENPVLSPIKLHHYLLVLGNISGFLSTSTIAAFLSFKPYLLEFYRKTLIWTSQR